MIGSEPSDMSDSSDPSDSGRQTVRIFIASPGDVLTERNVASTTIKDISEVLAALAPEVPRPEVVRWEDMVPGFSAAGPQGVVDEQMGRIDVFLGIMAARFGTPTSDAGSGTEHEFNRAYADWSATGHPQILLYFSDQPIAMPRDAETLAQLGDVLAFKERVSARGLVCDYRTVDEFRIRVRGHLLKVLQRVREISPLRRTDAEADLVATRGAPAERAASEIRDPGALSFGARGDGPLETVPAETRIRITEVSARDAYRSEPLEGKIATVLNLERWDDEWWHGKVRLDGGREITIFELKFEPL